MNALPLEVHRERKRGIFGQPSLRKVTVTLRSDYSLAHAAEQLLQVLEDVFPSSSGDAVNVRGRPRESLPNASTLKDQEEELFFAAGKLVPPDNDESIEDFHYVLKSRFRAFEKKNILYSVSSEMSASLKPLEAVLSPRLVTRLVPAELNHVRFGVELFRSSFLGSLIGLVPVVDRRLFFELTKNSLQVIAEEAKAKSSLPLEPYLKKVDRALDDLGLCRGLVESLQKSPETATVL